MRTNYAHFNVVPVHSLKTVAFRATFMRQQRVASYIIIRGRNRRGVALKHDFLLAQLGRERSGRGEVQGGGRPWLLPRLRPRYRQHPVVQSETQ